MAPQQVQWGTTTLILDNEAFRRGFLAARHGICRTFMAKMDAHRRNRSTL